MQTGIDFTARCMAAEASEQINKASTGFADLDTRLDTMDIAIEQAQQAIHFKGFVNYYDDLPDDAEENDAYTVLYSGINATKRRKCALKSKYGHITRHDTESDCKRYQDGGKRSGSAHKITPEKITAGNARKDHAHKITATARQYVGMLSPLP